MTTTTSPATTDRHGFPIRTCGRCGGSGHYSYNSVHGSVCYGCSGTGWTHTAKAAKAYSAWREACRAARQVLDGNDLAPGDEVWVKPDGRIWTERTKDGAWATVTAVAPSVRRVGSSLVGTDEAQRVHKYAAWVTLADGTVQEVWHGARRKADVPAAPFVADAQPGRRR